jgi:uncharacterized protein YoxC
MTFVHIGVFIMAVAFAIVAVFIAKLLLRVSGVIGTVGQTVSNMESKLDKTVIEFEQTITETNATAMDIEEKSLALNSVFYTIKHVGDSTSLLSEELSTRTGRYTQDTSLPGTKPFVRIIQFSEFASNLFNSWKRGKSASSKQF